MMMSIKGIGNKYDIFLDRNVSYFPWVKIWYKILTTTEVIQKNVLGWGIFYPFPFRIGLKYFHLDPQDFCHFFHFCHNHLPFKPICLSFFCTFFFPLSFYHLADLPPLAPKIILLVKNPHRCFLHFHQDCQISLL